MYDSNVHKELSKNSILCKILDQYAATNYRFIDVKNIFLNEKGMLHNSYVEYDLIL